MNVSEWIMYILVAMKIVVDVIKSIRDIKKQPPQQE